MCLGRESDPHERKAHNILSVACLPVSPPRRLCFPFLPRCVGLRLWHSNMRIANGKRKCNKVNSVCRMTIVIQTKKQPCSDKIANRAVFVFKSAICPYSPPTVTGIVWPPTPKVEISASTKPQMAIIAASAIRPQMM